MADTQTYVSKVSEQLLDTVRTAQDVTVSTLGLWAQAAQALSPQSALPQAAGKWTERVPQPSALVDEMYDAFEKVVANQREFSHKLIAATTPAPAAPTQDAAAASAAKKK